MQAQGDEDEKDRIREHEWHRQERNTEDRVSYPARIPQPFGNPFVRRGLVRLDRHPEHGLCQEIQEPGAEQRKVHALHGIAAPRVQHRPNEVDDDAEVRQLEREPDVRPPGEYLELAAAELDRVENGRIDVPHRSGE